MTEPIFFCVLRFDDGAQDFVLDGIYSKEEDALAFMAVLGANGGNYGTPVKVQWNLSAIREFLISERLGGLQKVLEQLAAKIDPHWLQPKQKPVRESWTLFGLRGLPAWIQRRKDAR